MKTRMIFALLTCLSLAGAAYPAENPTPVLSIGMPAPIIVSAAPPEGAIETPPPSPGSNHIWIPGHPSWRTGSWAWVPGAWMLPPHAGLVWVEGRWDIGTNSWTGEHWRYAQTTPPPAVTLAPSAAPSVITVRDAPPPPRVERRKVRPGPDYVWVNGYWLYRGGRHVWVAGHWTTPPRGHHVWIEPRWERRPGGYVFIEGRWR